MVDAGDSFSIDTSLPTRYLENDDVARLAHSLLLLSKDMISEEEFNSTSVYSGMNRLEMTDALDRLNIDAKRSFSINGVEMAVDNDIVRVISSTGIGATAPIKRDAELESIRRKLELKSSGLPGQTDITEVDASDLTISELLTIRDNLEKENNFVAYDFERNMFVAGDNFSAIFDAVASIPDGFFFGANVAFQVQDTLGDTVSEGAKRLMFATTLNYFSNVAVGAMTGLPSQLRSEYEDHTYNLLTQLVGQEEATKVMDELSPVFQSAVQNVFQAIGSVSVGAGLEELREGLGISFSGSTYTVNKFTLNF